MNDYVRRLVDDELDELITAAPAIAIEGAKGVGKTATALLRAATVFELDSSPRRQLVQADPESFSTPNLPSSLMSGNEFPRCGTSSVGQ